MAPQLNVEVSIEDKAMQVPLGDATLSQSHKPSLPHESEPIESWKDDCNTGDFPEPIESWENDDDGIKSDLQESTEAWDDDGLHGRDRQTAHERELIVSLDDTGRKRGPQGQYDPISSYERSPQRPTALAPIPRSAPEPQAVPVDNDAKEGVDAPPKPEFQVQM